MHIRKSHLIGEGNFSKVYHAKSANDRQDYAWKELKSDTGFSDVERFRREVEILSKFHHEHIIAVIFTDLLAPQPYFVMPKAKQNLGTAIKFDTARKLDIGRIFKEICEAVIYAHEKNVLHRDLKPQNILLTHDGSVRVSDFGLARSFCSHPIGLTKINQTGGTFPYAAPEQFENSMRDVDVRADIYSLGKILYYLYTKRDPYHIDASDPNLPVEIYDIVRKATDLDIARRFDTTNAMLKEFMKFEFGALPSAIQIHKSHPTDYVEVQLRVQDLAKRAKAERFISVTRLEEIASQLHRVMWLNREVLWENTSGKDPLKILDATAALRLLGFHVSRPTTLGTFFDDSQEYEVAGEIDQDSRIVSISSQFNPEITKFTEAHELGHALLHKQQILHRDRPINNYHSTRHNPEEHQANKFASYFLMPRKQVKKKFKDIFGTDKFEFTREMSEALIQDNVAALVTKTKNRRGLSRFIASANQIGIHRITSLSEIFEVSTEAMAIRLEEIGII